MNGHVRFTLFGILITLIVSGSCNVTDPKKMIEIAAEHESPHSELTRLYAASVLPDVDESMAWVMAQDFAQRLSKITEPDFKRIPQISRGHTKWKSNRSQEQLRMRRANPFGRTLSVAISTSKTSSEREFVSN